jgi:hypothetical protein
MGQVVQLAVEDPKDSLFCMYPAISESDWQVLCLKVEKKIKERATRLLSYSLRSLSTQAEFLM